MRKKWKMFVLDNTAEQFSQQNQIFTFQTIMKTLKHFSEYFLKLWTSLKHLNNFPKNKQYQNNFKTILKQFHFIFKQF